MEDNFPISNIPLIFTLYRTRVLEESGQEWFHSQNNPDEILEEMSQALLIEEEMSQAPLVEVVSEPLTPSVKFEHPDPWEPSPRIVEEAAIATPLVETLPLEDPTTETASSPPASTIQLFPLEQLDNRVPEEITGIYDLTEFDNGEIEAPPVAVRGSQSAKFEKIHRPVTPAQNQNQSEDQSLIDSMDLETVDPTTLSPAELAKYRLRNCL